MPIWFDHLFVVVLAVLFPLRAATFGFKRLRTASLAQRPAVRVSVYRQAMVLQWGLLTTLVTLWILTGRVWGELGVARGGGLGFWIASTLLAIAVGITIWQRRGAIHDDEALESVRKRVRHVSLMLPHTREELGLFYRLSFTAGVCEEFLYRGYLIWYFAAWLGPIPAAIVASVIFGLGHSYQGVRGIVATALVGAIFATLYLVSGSLLVPILAHVLLDAHSGHLAFRAYKREREQWREHARKVREQWLAERAEAERRERTADVIVVGLGAMGSAAADHLTRRGFDVLGFDRFHPPHDRGSSHGETRLIREAYFENPQYVPLVQRAFELWTELEEDTGHELLKLSGGLMIGRREESLVAGALRSAEVHSLPHEVLDAATVRRKYPAFRPADDMVAVWEPRTGVLLPEACVSAHLERASHHGARFRFDEPVEGWSSNGSGVEVRTANGTYNAAKLILCSGPWIAESLAELNLPITVSRQPLHWYTPRNTAHLEGGKFPAYIWEHETQHYFYGFPLRNGEAKVAFHMPGGVGSAGDPWGEALPGEADDLTAVLERFMPDLAGEVKRSVVCRYTNLPDSHFLIDFHPAHRNVLVTSICSGHGFKFASTMGEILADLVTEGKTRFDLGLFGIGRYREG